MDPARKNVFYYAVGSRCAFILLSSLFDLIIPDYKSDSFKAATYVSKDFNSEDNFIWKVFGGLLQWDAHHFLHIAQFGYTYENNLAFFPLYPLLVKALGNLIWSFGLLRNYLSALLLSGVLINNFTFVKSALVLYDLTLFIFNDTKFSFRTSIFFCISPATIFFVAPYTETLFSYFAFKGMLEFSRRRTKSSLLWFILSVCIRSNGITFAGFILHAWAYYCFSQLSLSNLKNNISLVLGFTFHTLQYVFYIFSPFLIFQIYSYLVFCIYKPVEDIPLIVQHAEIHNLTMASDYICWCKKEFKFPYFAIQEKLWNVGFLKYFVLKQIPNFVLALPISFIIIYNGLLYLKKNFRMLINPKRIYSYGIFLAQAKEVHEDYPPSVFLFFIHVLFLAIWGLLNINVQVLTRLLASSSPILYWVAANHFEGLPSKTYKNNSLKNKFYLLPFEKEVDLTNMAFFIKWYFIGYSILGILLFSNGLPWT